MCTLLKLFRLGKHEMSSEIVCTIEDIIMNLLYKFVTTGVGNFKVPCGKKQNSLIFCLANLLVAEKRQNLVTKDVEYNNTNSRHHFVLMVYIMSEIHRYQLIGGSCNSRGLYYRDCQLMQNQTYIVKAIMDVTYLLKLAPWHLGMLSSAKGLIAGDLRIFMNNGDIFDCKTYGGTMSLPQHFEKIERIHTQASFVLIVEKQSVFENLLSHNIFEMFDKTFILLTGKGYPDYSTRRFVHYFNCVAHIPVYAVVDADPYGIEIMLTYRYALQTENFRSEEDACSKLHWIGLHPSEIYLLKAQTEPLNERDYKKLDELLNRKFICETIKREIYILYQLHRKAEIDSVLQVLIADYIPNKIKRHIFL